MFAERMCDGTSMHRVTSACLGVKWEFEYFMSNIASRGAFNKRQLVCFRLSDDYRLTGSWHGALHSSFNAPLHGSEQETKTFDTELHGGTSSVGVSNSGGVGGGGLGVI